VDCTRRAFIAFASASFVPLRVRSLRDAGVQSNAPGDVPWLREVIEPPASLPTPSRPLTPLLVDSTGRPISSVEAWQRRRSDIEHAWRDVLGDLGMAREQPPRVEIVEQESVGEVVRERVRYVVAPDVHTEAYVLRPRTQSGPRRGAIVFHTTTPQSIRQPAGLADVPEKHFGLALARRGFVAFCPRNFLWPDTARMAADAETQRFHARHPRARGMARMLFDGQVALDILAARPDVDPRRIGCIGHSLGAKEALYLAAFDSRIRATVSSEGGIGLKMSNWDAPWYLGDIVNDPGFTREHHELLALAAPRPFLLVGGDSADGDASWPWIAAAQSVYRLYETPPRLGLLNHRRGHAVPSEIEPRLMEWMEAYV
jgi:dienelactone hydrolase